MTAAELLKVYDANAGIGHLEACEAVLLAGYYMGAGIDILPAHFEGIVARLPAPKLVTFTKPDLR